MEIIVPITCQKSRKTIYTLGRSEKTLLLFIYSRELNLVWFNIGNEDPVSKKVIFGPLVSRKWPPKWP